MSLNTHARCDRCEAILHVTDEDELIEEGWLTVRYGLADERQDFCTLDCLHKWASSTEAGDAVTAAMQDTDEPDDSLDP